MIEFRQYFEVFDMLSNHCKECKICDLAFILNTRAPLRTPRPMCMTGAVFYWQYRQAVNDREQSTNPKQATEVLQVAKDVTPLPQKAKATEGQGDYGS